MDGPVSKNVVIHIHFSSYHTSSGFGTHMIGTEMVVLWPNDDGNVTLSRRKATQHTMPPVDDSPSAVATLSTSDTQVSSEVARNISDRKLTSP
jgi:hypothetical protein